MNKTPDRLRNEMFFKDDLPVRLYHQHLTKLVELHWHEFYELTFVLSGAGTNIVNGVSHALRQGDLFLLTPADFHEISPCPGQVLELYNLIFSQQMLSDEMVRLLFSQETGVHAHFDRKELCDGIEFRFKCIMHEKDNCNSGREIALKCDLDRLLIEWQRHRVRSPLTEGIPEETVPRPAFSYHSGILKSLIYIQHHFRQPITLELAAGQAHLSPNYFSELFRKTTGVSFQHHLQQVRLQFAGSLLRASKLPVTEICHVSGFHTLTHFEKVFRLRYGMTPREFQKISL